MDTIRVVCIYDFVVNFMNKFYPDGVQIFFCESLMNDYREVVYNGGGIVIKYAPGYDYLEILGFTAEEEEKFNELFEIDWLDNYCLKK